MLQFFLEKQRKINLKMTKKYLEGTANNLCGKAIGWISLDFKNLNKNNINEIFIDLIDSKVTDSNGKKIKLLMFEEVKAFFFDDLKRNNINVNAIKLANLYIKITPLEKNLKKGKVITYYCECNIKTNSKNVSHRKIQKEKLMSNKDSKVYGLVLDLVKKLSLKKKDSSIHCESAKEFDEFKDKIISKCEPSTGDNLLGFDIDLDYFLWELDFKKSDHRMTKNKESLLEAKCKLKNNQKLETITKKIVEKFNDFLRYQYFAAYYLEKQGKGLVFHFITQIAKNDFYVAGRIEIS